MQTARQADPAKLARIAIMTLDFGNMLKLPNNANGTLEVFDIAQMYADTYGVHNVEFQHSHILSTETGVPQGTARAIREDAVARSPTSTSSSAR